MLHRSDRGGEVESCISELMKKLRKVLPKGFCSDERDPYYTMVSSGFEPEEPKFHMWNADLSVKGRGKSKKSAMVVMNARCGFAVMLPVPPVSDTLASMMTTPVEERNESDYYKAVLEYRETVRKEVDQAVYEWMVNDYYPEDKVSAALGNQIVFVKSNDTFQHRVTELCQQIEQNVENDPMELEQRKLNAQDRKFGNSPWYRRVEDETADCLDLTREEAMEMIRKKYWRNKNSCG